jgi:hypothetical protein
MAIRALGKGRCTFKERAGPDECPDFPTESGLSFSIPNGGQNRFCVFGVVTLKILHFCPSLHTLEAKEAGVDAINEVVEAIGGVVGPIHDFALNASKSV